MVLCVQMLLELFSDHYRNIEFQFMGYLCLENYLNSRSYTQVTKLSDVYAHRHFAHILVNVDTNSKI